MTTDPTKLTASEIAQYRKQFKDYPEALKALDAIQECEGSLEYAHTLLLMRETGSMPDRAINFSQLVEKSRPVICRDGREDVLEMFNVVASFLPPPSSQALNVVLYVVKIGTKNFCRTT
jgi:hypothetical protein